MQVIDLALQQFLLRRRILPVIQRRVLVNNLEGRRAYREDDDEAHMRHLIHNVRGGHIVHRTVPRIRLQRERTYLENITEEEVIQRYRLSSAALHELYAEIRTSLESPTERAHAIPGMVKMLASIHFLASGSFQTTVGVVGGISQSSFCRALHKVVNALCRIAPNHIHFPRHETQWIAVRNGFYNIAGMPLVLGAIDCTHIAFSPPSLQEHVYRNRKHFHSLNVQVVCDARMRIMSVVSKFPGSAHDSSILMNSSVSQAFMDGNFPHGWLIGDSGYAVQPWLMTPLANPTCVAETNYNAAHIATRGVIERTFGLLKSRFRCLDKTGGTLLYSPTKVAKIVIACCVLHNVAVKHNMSNTFPENVVEQAVCPDIIDENPSATGSQTRRNVIDSYFTGL